MTNERITEIVLEALKDYFYGLDEIEADAVCIGQIEGEDCIGLDYAGGTWFIEIKEG
jgi:hypothetical protein